MKNKIGITNKDFIHYIIMTYGQLFANKYEIVYIHKHTDFSSFGDKDIIIFGGELIEIITKRFIESNNSYKIFLDVHGEVRKPMINLQIDRNDIDDYENNIIKKWLENNKNYFISQRHKTLTHPNAITGHYVLSLFYYFTLFNYHLNSKITPNKENCKYDFLTFLGINEDKRKDRLELLNHILDGDLSNCKYDHNDFDNHQYFLKFGLRNRTQDLSWNILQSLNGKINLIFETTPLEFKKTPSATEIRWEVYDETHFNTDFFFTEKTLRCLITPHPSVLIVNPYAITYLKSIGYDFPYNGFKNYDDLKIYINSIKSNGIDNWVNENKKMFENNTKLFWKMVRTPILELKNIFEKITI